jgi:hypothetical protein
MGMLLRYISSSCTLGFLSRAVKQLRCEAEHSHASRVKVKNGGAICPLPKHHTMVFT